jgi:hypothetical protein
MLASGGVLLMVWWILRDKQTSQADFAAWIEALSTLAAVFIATLGASYAFRAYVIEEGREQRVLTDLRQVHAARVAAWYTTQRANTTRARGPSVVLRNASDLPVSGVVVTTELWGLTHHGPEVGEEPEWKMVWSTDQKVGLLPPSAQPVLLELEDYQGTVAARNLLQEDPEHEMRVSITFRDSNNTWWCRDADGLLDELGDGDHWSAASSLGTSQ